MIDKDDAVITAVYSLNDNINEMKDKLDNLEEKLSKTITTNSLQQKDIELTKEEVKLMKKEIEIIKNQVYEIKNSKDKENTKIVSFVKKYIGNIILSIVSAGLLVLLGIDHFKAIGG